ncbi:hypothetical protein CP532_6445 [Ophiocordyceps camponoti-leonardi (nom. inval.)]|nr:hypothetical protein CP532_6445 [Ophiocordyceps camponoti-leonardi (nom. inval.)]
MKESSSLNLPDGYTYTDQRLCDNTLDDAQLATRCPLDNMRRADDAAAKPARYSVGQLDQLPAELLVQVLVQVDVPSLTDFRRVNRRAMELVDSITQYSAIIKHCPNIIRAIVSIRANAYDCNALFRTLSSKKCSTCQHFGDHLYLIDCCRVCYFCYTRRPEFFPLTLGRASRFFVPSKRQRRDGITSRKLLRAAKPPSVLSLPGEYCITRSGRGVLSRKRLQLFDRRAIVQDPVGSVLPDSDRTTREPVRFMAIITAPYLFDSGRQADWGCFCVGCMEETDQDTRHFRIKYTREDILEHIARYGPVKEMPRIPGRFTHAT